MAESDLSGARFLSTKAIVVSTPLRTNLHTNFRKLLNRVDPNYRHGRHCSLFSIATHIPKLAVTASGRSPERTKLQRSEDARVSTLRHTLRGRHSERWAGWAQS